jgi:hypothetical protein
MGLLDAFTSDLSNSDGSLTPAGQGLLATGLGILAHNRGLTSGTQAIGMGGLEGLSTYQGAKQAQMQQKLQSMQLQGLGINNAIALQNYQDSMNPSLWGQTAPTVQTPPGAPQGMPGGVPAQMDSGGLPPGAGGSGAGVQSMPVPMVAGAPPQDAGGPPMLPPPQVPPSMAQGQPGPQGVAAQPQQAPQTNVSPMNPLGLPVPLAQSWFRRDPSGYLKDAVAPAYSPTDIQKLMLAQGIDPKSPVGQMVLQEAIKKATNIPPVSVRPGGGLQEADGTIRTMPAAAPAGFQAVQGPDGGWSYVPVAGGTSAITQSTAAEARGKAGYKLAQVYNPATRQMEFQTDANIADGANGGAPPMPSIPTPPGMNAPPGSGQPPPLPPGSTGYPGAQGTPPSAPPQSAPPGYPGAPGGTVPTQTQGGGFAAAPPLGTQADANAKATGQVDTMQQSYKEARTARASGQNALTLLDDMSNYAQTKSPALANKLYNVQGIFSSDAQLFGKARDNLISQVSGATGMNTDAARQIVEGSIPSFGMNAGAIQTGLGQIKGQVQMRMLKGDYLSDAYANGDAPTYNQRENQFDQAMTPTAAAIIKMPPGPARNQAIQAAKQNPQDAQALRWGLSTGLLH